ncbi:hypothetical protein V491_02245 [Pseudogymnoascus sp. VKM F-3775]|nr:hypothetical protein V491_02245 [Pseudogymnoascus sp. VKM F-3775]
MLLPSMAIILLTPNSNHNGRSTSIYGIDQHGKCQWPEPAGWETIRARQTGTDDLGIKTSDGPVGVRGGIFTDGVRAASLPSGVSLAATWDSKIIQDVCTILIAEAKSKEVDVLLGPTVCIPRTPLGGRNFEAYSEDPFLTGKLAGVFINSIQDAGIGACIKHFAANDQETRRFFIDEKIPDRALREIHLQPFQIAIRDSAPWTLMTAYNKINGTYCSAHELLTQDVLRKEWGWDGLVMSDWFGTNSIVPSLKAGLDLEMPGPFADWQEGEEQASDLPEHREILRRAAAEGIVLLKNSANILPFGNLSEKTIAIVGPNAMRSVATGGGSSNLEPHYRTTPYESIKAEVLKKFPTATIKAHPGILSHRYLPLLDPAIMENPETGDRAFLLSFWRNLTHEGSPFLVENRPSYNLVCYDGLPAELTTGERYSYRGRCVITPKTTGVHEFSLSSCGPGKLILDGKVLLEIERHWWSPKSALFMSYGSPEERIQVHMTAGRDYELVLESVSREPKPYDLDPMAMLEREEIQDGGRIGFVENPGNLVEYFKEAVDLAKSSDFAIVVVGKDQEWETETSDMVSMDLPGQSNALISAVAEANPNVIVVNQTGSPFTMPWEADVTPSYRPLQKPTPTLLSSTKPAALLPCPGRPTSPPSCKHGTKARSKLPITFPRRIEDNPSYCNYPGDNDVVHYGEGIYAGYRFYDHRAIKPLFPFGARQSYTTFEYSNIRLDTNVLAGDGKGQDKIVVQVDITNTGTVDGKEIVQFYVSQSSTPRLSRPPQELKGWDKVFVRVGETVTAQATLDRVSISYWDNGVNKWVINGHAEFTVTAAKHSRDEEGPSIKFHSLDPVAWIN